MTSVFVFPIVCSVFVGFVSRYVCTMYCCSFILNLSDRKLGLFSDDLCVLCSVSLVVQASVWHRASNASVSLGTRYLSSVINFKVFVRSCDTSNHVVEYV